MRYHQMDTLGFMVFLQTSDIFISGIFGLKKEKPIGDDET